LNRYTLVTTPPELNPFGGILTKRGYKHMEDQKKTATKGQKVIAFKALKGNLYHPYKKVYMPKGVKVEMTEDGWIKEQIKKKLVG
jgi:hypothetical protein